MILSIASSTFLSGGPYMLTCTDCTTAWKETLMAYKVKCNCLNTTSSKYGNAK